MLFSSLGFLYLFLPLTLAIYFACPLRARNGVLLAVSLLFYGFGEPIYVFLMILTVLADYGFGLWISHELRRGGNGRRELVAAVVFNLALLGFFKYYDWLASAISLPTLGLDLPIGISFYTFQALSYVVDVYRRETEANRDLVAFGAYVALFPQLIAGPIVRYREIDGQLRERRHTVLAAAEGISRFCVGLSKKVLLANGAGELGESLLASAGADTVTGAWLRLLLYAFQIYFDFSGYSDMAVGLGKIFGFDFPENFRYPYVSRSITEFWRRWHVTLSSWFREYVYIPLGGNRRGRRRTYRNLLITWGLTGLWHGAAWNFLAWGLYFFVILAIEKAFLGRLLERLPVLLRHTYALLLILMGWLIFASDGSTAWDGVIWLGRLLGVGASSLAGNGVLYELTRAMPLMAMMAIGVTPLPLCLWRALTEKAPRTAMATRCALCVGALLLCTAYLVDSGYNPFLYFRF